MTEPKRDSGNAIENAKALLRGNGYAVEKKEAKLTAEQFDCIILSVGETTLLELSDMIAQWIEDARVEGVVDVLKSKATENFETKPMGQKDDDPDCWHCGASSSCWSGRCTRCGAPHLSVARIKPCLFSVPGPQRRPPTPGHPPTQASTKNNPGASR